MKNHLTLFALSVGLFALIAATNYFVCGVCARGQIQSDKIRVLDFPGKRPLGHLFLLAPHWRVKGGKGAQSIGPATGTVKVLPGQTLMFVANDLTSANMAMFRGFPADAIGYLDLKSLSISDTQVECLAGLTGLRRLELSQTDVTDIGIAKLAPLKNLEYLAISRTLVRGKCFAMLRNFPYLRTFHFDGDAVSAHDCKQLAKCRTIRGISAGRCHLTNAALLELCSMSELQSLCLPDNRELTDSGIKKVLALKNLQRLDVAGTKVTDDGLAALSGLKLQWLRLNSKYNDVRVKHRLRMCFPGVKLVFEHGNEKIPLEVFAPLH